MSFLALNPSAFSGCSHLQCASGPTWWQRPTHSLSTQDTLAWLPNTSCSLCLWALSPLTPRPKTMLVLCLSPILSLTTMQLATHALALNTTPHPTTPAHTGTESMRGRLSAGVILTCVLHCLQESPQGDWMPVFHTGRWVDKVPFFLLHSALLTSQATCTEFWSWALLLRKKKWICSIQTSDYKANLALKFQLLSNVSMAPLFPYPGFVSSIFWSLPNPSRSCFFTKGVTALEQAPRRGAQLRNLGRIKTNRVVPAGGFSLI